MNFFIPKQKNFLCFSSFPDLSDNSYAIFKYILKNNKINSKLIWLLSDLNSIELYKKMIYVDLEITVSEVNEKVLFIKKNSIRGIYYYIRSKHVFFTHGLYSEKKIPKNHILINLWHGMPLKNVGKLDGKEEVPKFSYTVATSKKYQIVMEKVFDVPKRKVLITGQPRCDLLFENKNSLLRIGIQKDNYNKVIFWAPTYRQSIIGDIRNDVISENILGLPVVSLSELKTLNEHLEKLNSFLIIKIHPMDILNLYKLPSYSHILVLNNEQLLTNQIQLYNLLGECDALLTDYSSIYIDYLLLNKPILFVASDFDEYLDTRGFLFSNMKELMPGPIASNFTELIILLKEIILNDLSEYKEKRLKTSKIFNKIEEKFSDNLISNIKTISKG